RDFYMRLQETHPNVRLSLCQLVYLKEGSNHMYREDTGYMTRHAFVGVLCAIPVVEQRSAQHQMPHFHH
ncbi:hypothetical protein L7F22_034768, partial [Adiantum nelumboides]|nr:hypothetical protein [Adiantum nelumboides]